MVCIMDRRGLCFTQAPNSEAKPCGLCNELGVMGTTPVVLCRVPPNYIIQDKKVLIVF
jgi:hypothetical protein